jgi:sortase (surface protein transpeptidase)
LGSAVILGHVDSVNGPAVFDRLVDLKVGDRVTVKLADGKTVHFKVIGLREYSKKNFPEKLVYGSRPYSALQLVTCGGLFDSQTHHYLSNIVVFTKLVS